jgi:hypothetical protein
MTKPEAIVPERIRNIRNCTFGWVDHNFLHHGYINRLSPAELLLYYFLVTVADRNGVSFYDYERICQFLKLDLDDYLRARDRLGERSLIAFQAGVFQVLSLPARQEAAPVSLALAARQRAHGDFQTFKDILHQLDH